MWAFGKLGQFSWMGMKAYDYNTPSIKLVAAKGNKCKNLLMSNAINFLEKKDKIKTNELGFKKISEHTFTSQDFPWYLFFFTIHATSYFRGQRLEEVRRMTTPPRWREANRLSPSLRMQLDPQPESSTICSTFTKMNPCKTRKTTSLATT